MEQAKLLMTVSGFDTLALQEDDFPEFYPCGVVKQ